jgi:hypothetical protein
VTIPLRIYTEQENEMTIVSGLLRITRWNDASVPDGHSQWCICRADDVKHGVTLPDDTVMIGLWAGANPTNGIWILGRYDWGCLLKMPAGIKKSRREEYRKLIEEDESTRIV